MTSRKIRILFLFQFFLLKGILSQCSGTGGWLTPDCFGDCNGSVTVTVTGQAPFTYMWSDGQTSQTATGICDPSPCYSVTVTDANGCVTSTTACMPGRSQAIINIVTLPSCSTCCDGVLSASMSIFSPSCSPFQCFWDNNLNCSGTLSNVCSGTHTFCISDACGCMICDSINVSFTTANENISLQNHVLIYPNPSNGIIRLTGNGEILKIKIYNLLGEIVLIYPVNNPDIVIDLSQEPKGVYFLHLESGKELFVQKLIIK